MTPNDNKRKPAQSPCRCDIRTRLVGDGCDVCNPDLAAKLAADNENLE